MKKVIAANWKMHKSPTDAQSFIKEFLPLVKGLEAEIIIFPQALISESVAYGLKNSGIHWGGQNSYCEEQGAFTGENSALTLKAMGASYVLVGHSERRSLFHETNELLAKKVNLVQKLDLIPMLCVGESLHEREAGKTNEVITEQLKAGLSLVDKTKVFRVAYEPVWAIGTGKVASPAQAAEAHRVLRSLLSAETPILYGGSVKPENAKELISQPNIDGFLVGGASLNALSFSEIVKKSMG